MVQASVLFFLSVSFMFAYGNDNDAALSQTLYDEIKSKAISWTPAEISSSIFKSNTKK